MKTSVYRYYDEDDRLIYVGIIDGASPHPFGPPTWWGDLHPKGRFPRAN